MRQTNDPSIGPVDGRYVHRVSASETFVGEASPLGRDRFSVPAVWPRVHGTYRMGAHPPDALLLCETFRQASYVVCHMQRGVPLGRKFLLSHMALSGVSLLGGPRVPVAPTVTVDIVELGRVESESASVRVAGEIALPGAFRASLTASGAILSERIYRRVRGGLAPSGPAAAPGAHAGRAPSSNTVLASGNGEPNTWRLVVNTAHPSHFDHPLDHVPGSLLLDAARSAMRAALGRPEAEPTSIDASFQGFVELAEPTKVRLADGGESMTVDFFQRGEHRARVDLVPPRAAS
ncbi:AfsA-related hotdog domain-containing protein [Sinomonas sp. JGH33]|uniref:AfsA-related hotdog domain-containing protein n=1 Tax=Sinomonas terricola TaxID=3110330 RepID=A0ABU5T5L4_9MICC|nr:AfsA-related hotdog domain-containing protein [Sinomonas sp. JGH33]MEA5454827.1 AfsA-related hotdog domain-containing protein [Sinomonas sp. JGH33]